MDQLSSWFEPEGHYSIRIFFQQTTDKMDNSIVLYTPDSGTVLIMVLIIHNWLRSVGCAGGSTILGT
jgi:hypothetical protein